MPRKKQGRYYASSKIAEQAAAWVACQIDATDWQTIIDSLPACRDCPARAGIIADADGLPLDVCAACPLRPLLYSLADLAARRQLRHQTEHTAE